MKKKSPTLFLLVSFCSLIHLLYNQSICEEIVANRKLQGGVKNSAYLNSLEKLNSIRHDDCIIQLEPKYVWAQNMSYIMVKFDFEISSRTSCAQVLYSEKNVTYNSFYLKQYCFESNQIIKYHVDVTTYKNMNFHFAKWKSTDMNGVILQVLKSPSPYFWPKLYSKNISPKVKPRIWWELQQKQDESTQKYMGLLEIDESQVQISSYVKKMKRKSNKDESKRKDSEIEFYCNEGSPLLLGSWY